MSLWTKLATSAELAAETTARSAADAAQTFAADAGKNPFAATTPLTPRFVGDRALNVTSDEWWDGTATAASATSWHLSTLGSGGVPEAPVDDTVYARQNGAWVEIPVSGDMLKSVYDADDDGVVDEAGHAASADTADALASSATVAQSQVDGLTADLAATAAAITAEATARAAADALLAPLASPALTGTPTAPTAASGASTTQIATTAFVAAADATLQTAITAEAAARAAADALLAPLASPALTGTPTAPTAAGGTSTTQVATTAFVAAALPPQVFSSSTENANPYTIGGFTPRFAGDRAYNPSLDQWWTGTGTTAASSSWIADRLVYTLTGLTASGYLFTPPDGYLLRDAYWKNTGSVAVASEMRLCRAGVGGFSWRYVPSGATGSSYVSMSWWGEFIQTTYYTQFSGGETPQQGIYLYCVSTPGTGCSMSLKLVCGRLP
jgi:hypothetical protein